VYNTGGRCAVRGVRLAMLTACSHPTKLFAA